MARPLRRVLFSLSARLSVLVTEIERLPMSVIAEYIAFFNLDGKAHSSGSGNAETDLKAFFGKRKPRMEK